MFLCICRLILLFSILQGVSAVGAFYELLSQPSLNVLHPEEKKHVAPVELCPILKTLYKILIKRFDSVLIYSSSLRSLLTQRYRCKFVMKTWLYWISWHVESETSMILFCRELSTEGILQALRDETMNDPRDRIEIAQSHAFYRPSLLGQPWCYWLRIKHRRKRSSPCMFYYWFNL